MECPHVKQAINKLCQGHAMNLRALERIRSIVEATQKTSRDYYTKKEKLEDIQKILDEVFKGESK